MNGEYRKKYNSEKFKNILNLIENKKYQFALAELKKYMQEYPKDLEKSIYQYGIIMLKLENFEEAKETFKHANKIANTNYIKFWSAYRLGEIYDMKNDFNLARYYYEQANMYKNEPFNDLIIFAFTKFAIHEGRLDMAEEYLNKTYNKETDITYKYYLSRLRFLQNNMEEAKQIIFSITPSDIEKSKCSDYIVNMIDRLKKNLSYHTYCYHDQQLLNYDKRKALQHIIKRHVLTKDFDDSINIHKLFDYATNIIASKEKTCDNLIDYYLIDYPGDNTRQIKVVCLPNTNKILSMYPYDEKMANEEYADDEIDELPNQSKSIAQISQIDKFNNRYKKVCKKS